jgi:cytochrome P450
MNTLFLFGEPIGMLSGSPPPHAQGFLDAFQEGFNGCGMRIALGPLKVLLPKAGWLKACAKTHAFADVYVDRALEYRKKHVADGSDPAAKQRTLLYNMAQQTGDRTVLRNQIVQAMMAATETTASLVSTVIHVLATHPDVFTKLRAEVLVVGDEPLNFDRLARIKYLQNVVTESKSTGSRHRSCD